MNSWTARDIKTIVKACAESGVEQLNIGDLQISFDKDNNRKHGSKDREEESQSVTEDDAIFDPQITDDLAEYEEELIQEAELSELSILDPVAYDEAVTRMIFETRSSSET